MSVTLQTQSDGSYIWKEGTYTPEDVTAANDAAAAGTFATWLAAQNVVAYSGPPLPPS